MNKWGIKWGERRRDIENVEKENGDKEKEQKYIISIHV